MMMSFIIRIIQGVNEGKNFSLLVWVGFAPFPHVILSGLTAILPRMKIDLIYVTGDCNSGKYLVIPRAFT